MPGDQRKRYRGRRDGIGGIRGGPAAGAKAPRLPATGRSGQPPRAVQQLLRYLHLHPLKQLGQNFLVDEDILQRIIAAADLTPMDEVLEIGPGLGILTEELVKRAAHVTAVEIDANMAAALRQMLAASSNLDVITADFLRFDPSAYYNDRPYKVVANLPYYITSPTLRHLFETPNRPRLLVVMVQKEVAERIVARPGESSLLSISVQVFGKPSLVTVVPPEAFYPPPKVESAVVRIDVYDQPALGANQVNLDNFFKVVQSGFSRKRKMLHNALAQSIWLPPGGAIEVLRAVGIDEKRRAQTLTIEEWAKLTRELESRGFL